MYESDLQPPHSIGECVNLQLQNSNFRYSLSKVNFLEEQL